MRALAKKHVDPRTRPQMLQQAFNMAEEASRRILETESFKRSSTVRFSGSVNHIYKPESEVNEVSWGRYNNYNKGGYKTTTTKIRITIVVKKDWNKDNKSPIRRRMAKRNSKDKDVLLYIDQRCKILLSCRL